MQLSRNYFHVYLFAAFGLGFTVMVAADTGVAVHFAERLVVDSQAVGGDLQVAYDWLRSFDLDRLFEENKEMVKALVVLPAAPLQAVSGRLADSSRRIRAGSR